MGLRSEVVTPLRETQPLYSTEMLSSAVARFTLTLSRDGSRIVPLSFASRIAEPVADIVGELDTKHRAQAMYNFAHVLGLAPTHPLVERTARDCFRQFGRYVAEILHVQGWGTENVLDRLEVEGAEHFAEAQAHGRGIVFVSGHFGATEIAAATAVLRGYRIVSVAERIRPDWLMEYMVRSRRRMGIELLPASGSGVSLLRTLRRGGMAAFVVDAGIDRGGAVPVTFFGRETLFPDGPARLARLANAPVVFGAAVRLPRGKYRAFVFPPLLPDRDADADADAARLTQALATTFELLVRRYPSQWYAFRRIWPEA
jgi:Kdo2-lipid IVA lauroyltransferase/acyltransferase